MTQNHSTCWLRHRCFFGLACTLLASCLTWAQVPSDCPELPAEVLTLDGAVWWALEHNPELAALRQQHGIAAGGVVIAQTYPFNPILQLRFQGANGPESAGISNRLPMEHVLFLELEVRHQGKYRRAEALAALSRTDWEIAQREQTVAVQAIRAFDTVIYRQEKLRLLEEIIRLNKEVADQVGKLADQAKLGAADLLIARTEVNDAQAQLAPGRLALTTAQSELFRALGVTHGPVRLQGLLDTPCAADDPPVLTEAALDHRADLWARRFALTEAENRLRLTVADRFGNPSVNPIYNYDTTRVNSIGAEFVFPLPVLNTRKGQIQQREAERDQRLLEIRQTEVLIQQEITAAMARWQNAQAWVQTYRDQLLPELQTALRQMERLFAQGGVDLLRLIDVRRKLLKARDGYLDALWEVRQACADLAAAAGDPLRSVCPHETAPQPRQAPAP